MTAPALSSAERDKLVGLLGLLGSDFDGERATAAAMASRFIRERRLTWDDVIGTPAPLPPPPRPSSGAPDCPALRAADVRLVLANVVLLTEWEATFVASVAAGRREG